MNDAGVSASEVSLARAIVAAVRAVPGVVDMTPGQFAEVATYGPGEKVGGVVINRTDGALDVEVHVCVRYSESVDLAELANQVREAVRQSVEASGGGPLKQVDVAIDDLRF
jgi:uncharacterized alkaline shock family protein YloU